MYNFYEKHCMLKDYKFLSESIHLVFSAHQEISGTELHIQNETHTFMKTHSTHKHTSTMTSYKSMIYEQ